MEDFVKSFTGGPLEYPDAFPGIYKMWKQRESWAMLQTLVRSCTDEMPPTFWGMINVLGRFFGCETGTLGPKHKLAQQCLPIVVDPMLVIDPGSASIMMKHMPPICYKLTDAWIKHNLYPEHLFQLVQQTKDPRLQDAWIPKDSPFRTCRNQTEIETMIAELDTAPLSVIATMDLASIENKYCLGPIRETLWLSLRIDVPNSPARNAQFVDAIKPEFLDKDELAAATFPSITPEYRPQRSYTTATTDMPYNSDDEDELEPTPLTLYWQQLRTHKDWPGIALYMSKCIRTGIPELCRTLPNGPWTKSLINLRGPIECYLRGAPIHNIPLLEHYKTRDIGESLIHAIRHNDAAIVQWFVKHKTVFWDTPLIVHMLVHSPAMARIVRDEGITLSRTMGLLRCVSDDDVIRVLQWNKAPLDVRRCQAIIQRLTTLGRSKGVLAMLQDDPRLTFYHTGHFRNPWHDTLLVWAYFHNQLINPEDVCITACVSNALRKRLHEFVSS